MNIRTLRKRNATGKMECDICNARTYLEVHHIEGRDIPNPDHISNLVCLCPNCHVIVHRGDIIIEQWASTTRGRTLMWHNEGEVGDFEDSTPYII